MDAPSLQMLIHQLLEIVPVFMRASIDTCFYRLRQVDYVDFSCILLWQLIYVRQYFTLPHRL